MRKCILLAAGFLSGCSGWAVQASPPAPQASLLAVSTSHAAWRRSLRHARLPGAGCFKASYPSTRWLRIACSTQRVWPEFLPRIHSNGDYSASVKPNIIASATGSFPVVSGVRGVGSTNAGSDSGTGSFSLQLNSQFFPTSACGAVAHCRGWIQFVYRNGPLHKRANLEIWDWLVSSTSTPLSRCPPNFGWHASSSSGGVDCYQTSRFVGLARRQVTKLAEMSLTGAASSAGDSVELAVGGTVYAVRQSDSILDVSSHWNFAEFNIFGYSTAGSSPSSARFNAGSSVTVSVEVDDGSTAAPQCLGNYSTTEEINNLTLGAPPANSPELENPSILFTESNPGKGTRGCDSLAGSG